MYKNAVIPAVEPGSRLFNSSRKPYLNLDSRFTVRSTECPGMTRKGFTLIELLVVVLIIGILAAVALPQYKMAVYKSRAVRVLAWGREAAQAAELYYLANGSYPYNLGEMGVEFPGCNNVDSSYMTWCDGSNGVVLIGVANGTITMSTDSSMPSVRFTFPLVHMGHFTTAYGSSRIICVPNSSVPESERICKSLSGRESITIYGGEKGYPLD